ncbi:MAG TPA: hypothetical protein PKA13_17945 [Geminicoccaceae bacterium]|nr:hypothetical protein [Geminicoccus sp.]HMU51662.1 hypothetical protein [Geminicoccaceae bacterium]
MLVGLATGALLGAWAFGLHDASALAGMLPAGGAIGAAVRRLSAGEPLPGDLLAAACLAAIVLLCLRDLLLDWQDRRRRLSIRKLALRR